MSTTSVSVTVQGVTKRFKNTKGRADVIAVRESDFTVAPGELVTLLGPSGCGKTTTLRMIGGFEIPSSGRILIGEEDVTSLPPNMRDTATVFQSYGLFPHMNVAENVGYGLSIRRLPKAEIARKVKATSIVGLAISPCARRGGFRAGNSSASPARKPSSSPRSSSSTSHFRTQTLLHDAHRIRRIRKPRHNGDHVTRRVEAMSLSDRVVVMKEGVIRQIARPSEIYGKIPKFVATSSPRWLFPVSVESLDRMAPAPFLAGRKIRARPAPPGWQPGQGPSSWRGPDR